MTRRPARRVSRKPRDHRHQRHAHCFPECNRVSHEHDRVDRHHVRRARPDVHQRLLGRHGRALHRLPRAGQGGSYSRYARHEHPRRRLREPGQRSCDGHRRRRLRRDLRLFGRQRRLRRRRRRERASARRSRRRDGYLLFEKVNSKLQGTNPPCGSGMPLTGAPLTAPQVGLIQAWIAAGALND
jgi:hypothetical protein